jgi:hypothetical protein
MILLCILGYGAYVLLGDLYNSMFMALVCSSYLREVKVMVEESIINFEDKSLLRRILIVRFLVTVYNTYRRNGFKSI